MTTLAPSPTRFTRSDYYRMLDAGVFQRRRVELVAGEIIEMPPMKNAHAVAIGLCEDELRRVFGRGHWVRVQMPLALNGSSEPQPDLAVVKGSPVDFKDHPKSALLTVEVSDSTLSYDQIDKASLYAKHRLPDYWIINLVDGQLEIYRDPVADRTRRFGFRYATILTLPPGDVAVPLAKPRAKIAIAKLLPPPTA